MTAPALELLNDDFLTSLTGGQLSVTRIIDSDSPHDFECSGRIKTIRIGGFDTIPELKIELAWAARHYPRQSYESEWMRHDTLSYAAILEAYAVVDLGDGQILLASDEFRETMVLFPKGDPSLLNPHRVRGLRFKTRPVAVPELNMRCTYLLSCPDGNDPSRVRVCNEAAVTAVLDTEDSWTWRCREHRGRIKGNLTGVVLETVPRETDEVLD